MEGRFHFDIAAAAQAVLRGEDIQESFQRVLAIGSTSGADSLFGLTDTAQALSKQPLTSRKEL